MSKRNKEDKYARRRLRTAYITTVFSMSLVLFMLGLFGLILLHANKIANHVKENIGITLVVKDQVKEVDIFQLQKEIESSPYAKKTDYITKEQAAEMLKNDIGEDFIDFLGYNPLLPTIEVRLNAIYTHNDSISKIESTLADKSIIKEIWYQKSLIHKINDNIQKISLVLLFFSVVLLVIAFALINNTIRLSVFSKRFLIKSMLLIGATEGFIRRPFLIKSIYQGIWGSFIAILLLVVVIYVGQQHIPELVDLQDIDMFLMIFGGVFVLGIFIALISNYFAVRKYLKVKTDSLYHF